MQIPLFPPTNSKQRDLPHVHGSAKVSLVGSNHISSTVGVNILINASILLGGAGRGGTVGRNGLLELGGVMVVGAGNAGKSEGGVDSAFEEGVGGCAEGGEVGCAGGGEDCLGRGDGGGSKGDGGDGCCELHLYVSVWLCEVEVGIRVCVRVCVYV